MGLAGNRMPTVKLTDAAVQKYKAAKGQRVEYFDATLPGFGLRVAGPTPTTPEGRKSWVLFYRHGGKQKRLTLGHYVEDLKEEQIVGLADGSGGARQALGLRDARKEAGEALQLVARGIDPAVHRAAIKAEGERKRDTIGTTVETFLTVGMKGKKGKALAPRYVAETRRNFENHVLPRWRDRDLVSINRRDVIALLDAIAAGEQPTANKKAKTVAGGPIAANRVLAAVRAMFNWALRRGMVEANPCTLVEQPGEETRRERNLSAEEIRELWPFFEGAGHPFGDFFRMALLTAQRRSEVAGMRWADIDFEARTWTIPQDQTKSGRGQVVPLSQAALDILAAAPRKTITVNKVRKPSPFVFTSDGSAAISGFSRAKDLMDAKVKKARIKTDPGAEDFPEWNIHDLRRTAATHMGRLGTSEFVIGKVLNHSARGVTGQVYNRYEYLEEKRHALEAWAAYLGRLTSPNCDNIVAIRA